MNSTAVNNLILDFAEPVARALPRLPKLVLTLLVGVLLIYVLMWLFEHVLRLARTPATLSGILSSIARVIMWVVLLATLFQNAGLPQIAIALSSSLALTGVALGAGAGSLVQDIIAGLFLVQDRDFNTGFRIKSGDIEGRVRRMDMRKIRIEDDKGKIHVVPTSVFDKTSWVVLDRNKE
jgi:small conductance mechanosensitive channel